MNNVNKSKAEKMFCLSFFSIWLFPKIVYQIHLEDFNYTCVFLYVNLGHVQSIELMCKNNIA